MLPPLMAFGIDSILLRKCVCCREKGETKGQAWKKFPEHLKRPPFNANHSTHATTSQTSRLRGACSSGRRSRSLVQDIDGIDAYIAESLRQSAGPTNLCGVDLRDRTQSEMHTHIAAGNVARATTHFIDEGSGSRFHCDAGT